MRFTKIILAVAVLSVTMLGSGPVAAAGGPQKQRCTMGEAQANFEAPLQHIFDGFDCQYRLFFDEQTFTYCEDDVILGGVNLFLTYQELRDEGWSRTEGIAWLERTEHRVWLDGIEQQLMRTAYKDAQHPTLGHIVFQQRAFITQIPVGDYVSYLEETFDGSLVFYATVQLHILPSTDALCS